MKLRFIKGTHWCFEIIQQLFNKKAEPAANFKTKFMLEFMRLDNMQELNDVPSQRLLTTNTRLKYFVNENNFELKVNYVM